MELKEIEEKQPTTDLEEEAEERIESELRERKIGKIKHLLRKKEEYKKKIKEIEKEIGETKKINSLADFDEPDTGGVYVRNNF